MAAHSQAAFFFGSHTVSRREFEKALGPTALIVWRRLVRLRDHYGYVFPSREYLAKVHPTGGGFSSQRPVKSALKRLRALGLVIDRGWEHREDDRCAPRTIYRREVWGREIDTTKVRVPKTWSDAMKKVPGRGGARKGAGNKKGTDAGWETRRKRETQRKEFVGKTLEDWGNFCATKQAEFEADFTPKTVSKHTENDVSEVANHLSKVANPSFKSGHIRSLCLKII